MARIAAPGIDPSQEIAGANVLALPNGHLEHGTCHFRRQRRLAQRGRLPLGVDPKDERAALHGTRLDRYRDGGRESRARRRGLRSGAGGIDNCALLAVSFARVIFLQSEVDAAECRAADEEHDQSHKPT